MDNSKSINNDSNRNKNIMRSCTDNSSDSNSNNSGGAGAATAAVTASFGRRRTHREGYKDLISALKTHIPYTVTSSRAQLSSSNVKASRNLSSRPCPHSLLKGSYQSMYEQCMEDINSRCIQVNKVKNTKKDTV